MYRASLSRMWKRAAIPHSIGRMRVLLAALATASFLVLGSCQDCPDGNAGDSLFCHAGDCAAGEMVCSGVCSNPQTDRDNCGECGNTCGDGLVCSGGQCVEGCAGGGVSCGGVCVDTQTDEMNCGACGPTGPEHVCDAGESCVGGGCVCTSGVVCAGACTDPMTSNTHCGATTDCLGGNAGTACMPTEGCVGGACVSRFIYRGSLKASTGRWSFQGMLGLNGANAECNARWPGSQVCSYQKLMMAATRAVPETVDAKDYENNAVASWWIDDPTALPTQRCQSNQDAIPWSYGTADQGHVGKYVTLTPATGAISELTTGVLPSCNGSRHVACCSTVIAP